MSIDEESLRAYNIDVANFDTYFVTDSASAAADLWVHNQGCGGEQGAGNKIPNCDLCDPPNKRGNAPIGKDGHPVELHHRNESPDGPLDEMTQTDHRRGDNFKKNHSNTGQEASKIDRSVSRKERK